LTVFTPSTRFIAFFTEIGQVAQVICAIENVAVDIFASALAVSVSLAVAVEYTYVNPPNPAKVAIVTDNKSFFVMV
jgi:hypothetical protein